LHDEIEMFAMHLLPPTTQKTCHHLYEVNRNAIREISNCHLILLCVKRWNGTDDVDLSTSWWKNFNRWQNNILQSLSNLPPICLLHWKLECCCSPNRLLLQIFGQASRFASWLRGIKLSFAKRVQGTHLHTSHRTNPTFSKVITSIWLKLIPTCNDHVDGTSGLLTQYFLLIPLTQWIKSSTQNKNLWWISVNPFKSKHKPL
jgi:hypothetical protein